MYKHAADQDNSPSIGLEDTCDAAKPKSEWKPTTYSEILDLVKIMEKHHQIMNNAIQHYI